MNGPERIASKGLGKSNRAHGVKAAALKLWRWSEVVLLLTGIVILAGFGAARLDSFLSSRAALKIFATLDESSIAVENTVTAKDEADANELEMPAEPDYANWDDGRVHAYKQANAKQTTAPLAVLEIAKIHVLAPLLDGTDSLTLNRGVGRIKGTAKPGEPGNIGIAGHRDSFFRSLKDIRAGDVIELRTRTSTDNYIVDRLQVVTPRDVSVLQPQSAPALTLVTCYPFYFIGSAPQRFVVTAYLTRHTPVGSTTSEARLNRQPGNSTQEEK
jgi:sortase A